MSTPTMPGSNDVLTDPELNSSSNTTPQSMTTFPSSLTSPAMNHGDPNGSSPTTSFSLDEERSHQTVAPIELQDSPLFGAEIPSQLNADEPIFSRAPSIASRSSVDQISTAVSKPDIETVLLNGITYIISDGSDARTVMVDGTPYAPQDSQVVRASVLVQGVRYEGITSHGRDEAAAAAYRFNKAVKEDDPTRFFKEDYHGSFLTDITPEMRDRIMRYAFRLDEPITVFGSVKAFRAAKKAHSTPAVLPKESLAVLLTNKYHFTQPARAAFFSANSFQTVTLDSMVWWLTMLPAAIAKVITSVTITEPIAKVRKALDEMGKMVAVKHDYPSLLVAFTIQKNGQSSVVTDPVKALDS